METSYPRQLTPIEKHDIMDRLGMSDRDLAIERAIDRYGQDYVDAWFEDRDDE